MTSRGLAVVGTSLGALFLALSRTVRRGWNAGRGKKKCLIDDVNKPVDLDFIRSLPKAELHAHLHGSISDQTILELAEMHGSSKREIDEMRVELEAPRNTKQCFKLFGMIHKVVTTHEAVTRVTYEALKDFADDNVKYIELRTTPREDEKYG